MASFNSAFASARRAGKKTFSWNGKLYTTQTAEEAAKAKATPTPPRRPDGVGAGASVPMPPRRPDSSTGSIRQAQATPTPPRRPASETPQGAAPARTNMADEYRERVNARTRENVERSRERSSEAIERTRRLRETLARRVEEARSRGR